MISCQILSSVFRIGLELISVNTKDMFKPLITVCAFCSTQLFIFGSQNGGGGRKMGQRIMKPGVVSLHHIDIVGSVKSFALVIHWLSGYTCARNYSLSVQNTGFGSAILLKFLFWFLLTVVVCILSWNECWRDWMITMEEKNAHCCAKVEWVSKQCLFGWAPEEGDIEIYRAECFVLLIYWFWALKKRQCFDYSLHV